MTLTVQSHELTSVFGLQSLGFEGFRTVASLRDEGLNGIAAEPGVYLVIRCNTLPPRFLATGTGGHFKGQDPECSRLQIDGGMGRGRSSPLCRSSGEQ